MPQTVIPSSEPGIAPFESRETPATTGVSVYISTRDARNVPDFWVGLFKQGDIAPAELYNFSSYEILENVASQGIDEGEALMLVDSTSKNPKSIYLINHDLLRHGEGLDRMVKALGACGIKKIGLYLCPSVTSDADWEDMFQSLMEMLVTSLPVREYHLFTGRLGMNRLINSTHHLKLALLKRGVNIQFFH